jgi:hypothetical protein
MSHHWVKVSGIFNFAAIPNVQYCKSLWANR